MYFSEAVVRYYQQLSPPANLPNEVETMNPFQNKTAFEYTKKFYNKFYADENERIILFGINPGRFGAGVTGIPFTDPVKLQEECEIPNELDKKPELSSRFIYEMINTYGGPEVFYERYYISAVSPLGYLKDGINLNYYDIKGYKELFEDYAVKEIKGQLDQLNLSTKIAFSIGKGKNIEFLRWINKKHDLFDSIEPLPHPRWVMQYRLKRKGEFIQEYLEKLQQHH